MGGVGKKKSGKSKSSKGGDKPKRSGQAPKEVRTACHDLFITPSLHTRDTYVRIIQCFTITMDHHWASLCKLCSIPSVEAVHMCKIHR